MTDSVVPTAQPRGNTLQLWMGTIAFALCFAVFGSVSAMMPLMRKVLNFSPMQASVAIAVPILLGSLGRIPLGILTDRFGGRIVFSLVMVGAIIPGLIMGSLHSYALVIVCGFFIGLALASFSVGVAFVSGWYPLERQGTALGIYGAGNIGQSLAAFGSPVIAAAAGYVWGFRIFALVLVLWLMVFIVLARNAPRRGPARTWASRLAPLQKIGSWELSLYYFLTFGGFVAMSVYLPIFLIDMFGLTPRDAGARTAGFIVLATAMRPVGGWIADRAGGRAVLNTVAPMIVLAALFLTSTSMVPFTVGALGMATAIGAGNGAVFKLVPEYFPNDIGSVTGLVGASGGLGGFFPPLVLGFLKQHSGTYNLGFIFLGVFAFLCFVVSRPRVLALCLVPPREGTRERRCSRAGLCIYAGRCTARPIPSQAIAGQ